jgi:hypothetical protein
MKMAILMVKYMVLKLTHKGLGIIEKIERSDKSY